MKTRYQLIGVIISFIAFASCNKDVIDLSTFSGVLESGGDFAEISYSETKEDAGETESQNGDEIWTCVSTKVSIEDALGGDNGFSLFSPNANVVFPGNLIQGKSLYKATPDEIPADRAGGEITISLIDGSPISTVTVEKISLGSVIDAANQILAGSDAETVIPANFQFSKSIIQSEKEFALRMKADYNNAWASVSGSLSFTENSTYSRMMVTLDQSFYQLSFSAPFNVEGFFAPTAVPSDLARFVGPGNPPCYISSVNYGRIFYMLIESSSSESELKAAVEAAFETPVAEGGGSVAIDQFESFEEVNIKIFALGGNAAVTLAAGGLTKNNLHLLNDILVKATDIRTAVPISYKVQSVKTNEVVAVQLATDYDKKTCYVTSALPPPVITEHWTGMREMLGMPIGAAVKLNAKFGPTDVSLVAFFDSLGVGCVIDDGEKLHGPYASLQEFYGNTVDIPFDEIGAGGAYGFKIFNLTYSRNFLINKRGNKFSMFESKTGVYTNPQNISQHPELDFYTTEGISAACNGEWGFMTVSKPGHAVHIEPYGGGDPLINELPVALFTGGLENKFPEGISGITKLDDFLYATIDKAGLRYMVADISNSQNVKSWGPFKL